MYYTVDGFRELRILSAFHALAGLSFISRAELRSNQWSPGTLRLIVAAGIIIGRTLPAMATTLVAFLVARIVVQSWVRPHFASPLTLSQGLTAENGAPIQLKPGGWVVSNNFFDSAGHLTNNIRCGSDAQTCMAQYHQVVSYHPAARYWTFQSYETAVFAGLSLVLIGLSFWWIRNRTS